MDGYRPLTLPQRAYLGWVAASAVSYLVVGLLLNFNIVSGVLNPLLVGAVFVLFAFVTGARLADAGWHPRLAALIVFLAVTVVPSVLILVLEERWGIPTWTILSDLGLVTLILIGRSPRWSPGRRRAQRPSRRGNFDCTNGRTLCKIPEAADHPR